MVRVLVRVLVAEEQRELRVEDVRERDTLVGIFVRHVLEEKCFAKLAMGWADGHAGNAHNVESIDAISAKGQVSTIVSS